MRRRSSALAGAAALGVACAALFSPVSCSRRDVDPPTTATATLASPPVSGSPTVPLRVRLFYTLSGALSIYPVAAWVEAPDGTFLRTLRAYEGNFQYAPSYVLPTWWGAGGGRGGAPPAAARPPGAYEELWDLSDWQGAPQPPGGYRLRVESSNWGTLWTDEDVAVSVQVSLSFVGHRFRGGGGTYVSAIEAEVVP